MGRWQKAGTARNALDSDSVPAGSIMGLMRLSSMVGLVVLRSAPAMLAPCCPARRLPGPQRGLGALSIGRDGQMARSQVVGNVGMYFAAYRLSQMGWNVMP